MIYRLPTGRPISSFLTTSEVPANRKKYEQTCRERNLERNVHELPFVFIPAQSVRIDTRLPQHHRHGVFRDGGFVLFRQHLTFPAMPLCADCPTLVRFVCPSPAVLERSTSTIQFHDILDVIFHNTPNLPRNFPRSVGPLLRQPFQLLPFFVVSDLDGSLQGLETQLKGLNVWRRTHGAPPVSCTGRSDLAERGLEL